MSVCMSGSYLNHPACKSHFVAPYNIVICRLCGSGSSIFFPHFPINATIFGGKKK